MLHGMTMEKSLNFLITKKLYIIIIIDSWYCGGELIHISIIKTQIGDIDIMTSAYGSLG